jgi:DNA-binding beta-propeller fold protein YncE
MPKLYNLLFIGMASVVISGNEGYSQQSAVSGEEGQRINASRNTGAAVDPVAVAAARASTPFTAESHATSSDRIEGRVQGGGKAIAEAMVTLWATGPSAARKLAETQTKDDGSFALPLESSKTNGDVLYLIAQGGKPNAGATHEANPAIVLMTTLGTTPPKLVTINELTTVASVWTGAQFLKGTSFAGNALGLRIAAGNVPNLVDIETGGLGPVIQDPLNSSQTPTLATFNTLGDLLAACITRSDACDKLFAAATPPGETTPTDTLSAMQNIARYPWHQPKKIFTLLDGFYPLAAGQRWRAVPFIPYLNFDPPAWTLSLVYTGGGLNSLGGIAIDGEGNMWADDNFLVGAQSTLYGQFGGGLSKVAPNGRPLSPMTFGYRGGGIDGPGFGIAISADDKVWATSLIGKNISVFDRKTGRPLSPETGYNFDGQLGAMQGIIVTPSGDVWALDNDNDQIVYLPKGDAAKGRILGRTVDGKSVDGTLQVKGPFHLAVDQQDRIWVTNSGSNTVTRFPASDPGKAEQIKVGFAPRAVAIDSLGNAWVANTVGHPGTREKLALLEEKFKAKIENRDGSMSKDDLAIKMWIDLFELLEKYPGGDVSMVRPDGTVLPPFDGGKSIIGPWGIAIDGNDHVWVANAMGHSVIQLCGARPETCPPGFKIGDPLSPPGGYVGGLQIITDVDIDPAGNVWVANNWDRPDQGFMKVPEFAQATRFGGNGTVVFFGLAKPVKTPLIGPPRAP